MMQLRASTLPSASPGATSLRAAISGSKGRRVRCIPRAEADGPAGAISGGASNPMDFDELSEIIRISTNFLQAKLSAKLVGPGPNNIRMVNSTDVVELELKSKRFSLSMRKKEAIAPPEAPPQPQVQYMNGPPPPQQFQQQPQWDQGQPQQQQQQSPQQQAPQQGGGPSAGAAAPAAEGTELLSPMGGTYYRSPAPGEPPFVREGDKVEKGQTVAIIEAMKLMNEIEAEVSGTVVKLVVENGSPVTPGQPLLIIDPN